MLFISTRAIGYIVACSVFQLEFKSPGMYIGFNVTNKNGIFKKNLRYVLDPVIFFFIICLFPFHASANSASQPK